MKAWKVKNHGSVDDSLLCEALNQPLAKKKSHVLVDVDWVALNHLDLWVLGGVDGHNFPLPLTPGCDSVGRVSAFGELTKEDKKFIDLQGIKEGTPVLIQPILYCGECLSCKKGFEATCEHFGLLGETQNGGAASQIEVPIKNLIKINNLEKIKQAVCLPIAYTTAYSMVYRKLKLQAGEVLFIQAAGSGVSVAAIQLAKKIGAVVVAAVRGTDRNKKLKDLGVDFIIQSDSISYKEDVKKVLKKINKKGFDCAIDHVGGELFKTSLRFLDWGGRIALCGATLESNVEIDLKPVFFKNLSIFGSTMGAASDLNQLLEWVEKGELTPIIDSEYEMTDLKNAYKKLQAGKVFGKILIKNNL